MRPGGADLVRPGAAALACPGDAGFECPGGAAFAAPPALECAGGPEDPAGASEEPFEGAPARWEAPFPSEEPLRFEAPFDPPAAGGDAGVAGLDGVGTAGGAACAGASAVALGPGVPRLVSDLTPPVTAWSAPLEDDLSTRPLAFAPVAVGPAARAFAAGAAGDAPCAGAEARPLPTACRGAVELGAAVELPPSEIPIPGTGHRWNSACRETSSMKPITAATITPVPETAPTT